MSLVIKRSELPSGRRGPATEPKVSIQENGQIQFNSFATDQLAKAGSTHVFAKADENGKAHVLTFVGRSAGLKECALTDMFELRRAKKTKEEKDPSGSMYFGGAGLCNILKYEYKASGTQSFDVEAKESKAGPMFVISLPIGALPRKATQKRTRKAEGEGGATGTTTPAAKPTEPTDSGDDLEGASLDTDEL